MRRVDKKMKNFLTVICLSIVSIIVLTGTVLFLKWIFAPKVAILMRDDKRAMKHNSPSGYIYYDETVDKVVSEFGVPVSNMDDKEHRIGFRLNSDEYMEYGFIKSEFEIDGIYYFISYEEKRYLGKEEIVIPPKSEMIVEFVATAEFGGYHDYRRAGPPIELVVLE